MVSNSKNVDIIENYNQRIIRDSVMAKEQKLDNLKVGMKVDFRCKEYIWCQGVVKSIEFDKAKNMNSYCLRIEVF